MIFRTLGGIIGPFIKLLFVEEAFLIATTKREKVILHEVTVQKLLRLIKDQNLQQGDKLPTERALAQELGISRTSLRESLQTLETNGIIHIRHGSGIYVDLYDESMLNPSDEADGGNYQSVLTTVTQMLQARKMTEPYCSQQAAKIITAEQLERLRRHEEAQYQRLYFRNGLVAAPGLDFEQLIVSFLGNPIISNMHKRLNSSWKSYLAILNAVVLPPNKRHKDHLAVIKALEEHDSNKAEKAMYQHLDKSEKSIIQLLKEYQRLDPSSIPHVTDFSID